MSTLCSPKRNKTESPLWCRWAAWNGSYRGPGAGPPEWLPSREEEVSGAWSWVGVGISRPKRPLSQTPLRRGQSQDGLGPFRPPRTLRLPGAPGPRQLGQAWLPAAAVTPPQNGDPQAGKPWSGLPTSRAAPRSLRPAIPRPSWRTGSRPRTWKWGGTSTLPSCFSPASLLPFSLLCTGPLNPGGDPVAPSPPGGPGLRHRAPSSGRLQDPGERPGGLGTEGLRTRTK